MTISETGICNKSGVRAQPVAPVRRATGFTLLELMVVLVLIGIIFSFAMLSFGGDDIADMMEEETRRFGALLALATDEAVMRGEELAVRFADDGYEFMLLGETGWQVPANDSLLRAYTLPEELRVRLQLEGDQPVFPGRQDDEDAVTPQVFILSSGELTPFTVVFESDRSRAQFHLSVSIMGEIALQRGQGL